MGNGFELILVLESQAVMVVGSNNLFPFFPTFSGTEASLGSPFERVYEGYASDAEIAAFANAAVAEVQVAADRLAATGVDLIVATAREYGIAQLTRTLYASLQCLSQIRSSC